MAYSKITTPRIYVDYGNWMKNMGHSFDDSSMIMKLSNSNTSWTTSYPSTYDLQLINNFYDKKIVPTSVETINQAIENNTGASAPIWQYWFYKFGHHHYNINSLIIPNHNFGNTGYVIKIRLINEDYDELFGGAYTDEMQNYFDIGDSFKVYNANQMDNTMNFDVLSNNKPIVMTWDSLSNINNSENYGGFVVLIEIPYNSYFTGVGTGEQPIFTPDDIVSTQLSGSSFCSYYDFPHGAEFSINHNYLFDGIDQKTTIGGRTLTNMRYSGKPNNPFAYRKEDGQEADRNITRSGRKSWDLNFTYLDDTNMLPKHSNSWEDIMNLGYAVQVGEPEDYEPSDNFVSNVLNRTIGKHLPFVFQPDNTDFDDLYICRFDQDDFNLEEVAPGTFNISLKIVETW